MERLTINELLDAYDYIMRVTTSGTPLYQRAESAHYYLQQLRHYQKLGVSFDHLRDLLQAEQDGRMVVLPCKAGSLIYVGRRPAIITRFFGYVRERYFCAVFCDENKGIDIPFEELGKTVFLTREEAEAAMAGKGGDR